MSSKTWDFSKIPQEEHENIIQLYENEDWQALAEIHDFYGLSNWNYGCCGGRGPEGIRNWFRYGIEKNFINAGN